MKGGGTEGERDDNRGVTVCEPPRTKHLKGLRLSCLLMVLRYDNGDTKPVYRELAGCSQVEAV